MHYELHISKQDMIQLEIHAETQLPQEAVALLFGTISNKIVYADRIEVMQNESNNHLTAFSVNPEEEYKLLLEADELGQSLVGIYHSHPAPPEPSQTDLKNMRLNPVVWMISSKLTGEWITKAFILDDEEVIEVAIKQAIS